MSLTVGDGEFVCLVCPSGCGKTTLLKLISGLLAPDSGRVALEDDPGDSRPQTALVFQQDALFPWMSVEDNVAFGLRMAGMGRHAGRARASAALADVGLSSFRQRYPHELSGGMRQRVNLVRALLANPHVLLMDEPFAWLDALTKVALQEEFVQTWLRRGCGVLYVTHDIEEAVRLGDRILVMAGGDGGGGTIEDEVRLDMPRPRDLVGALPAGAAGITARVWNILEGDVRRRLAATS